MEDFPLRFSLKKNKENINQYLNGKRIVTGCFLSSICGGAHELFLLFRNLPFFLLFQQFPNQFWFSGFVQGFYY